MSYGERLDHALKLAKTDRKSLGAAISLSVQAIGMVIRGESVALTAENSARAAKFLRVDHYWLATGDGQPRPDEGWPFRAFTSEQFYRLDESLREEIEDRLLGAIVRMSKPKERA